jgi:hypothetical protein
VFPFLTVRFYARGPSGPAWILSIVSVAPAMQMNIHPPQAVLPGIARSTGIYRGQRARPAGPSFGSDLTTLTSRHSGVGYALVRPIIILALILLLGVLLVSLWSIWMIEMQTFGEGAIT